MAVVRLVGIVLLLLGVKANRYFHQYHLILESKTWTEAQSYCREKYTDLATVDNMEDMNRLMAAGKGYRGNAWLGLVRANTRSWQWSDGSRALPYTNWAAIEPNDIYGTENCVEINSLGKWNDLSCQTQNYVACYKYLKGEPFFVVHSGSWTWNESQIHCKEAHVDMAVVLSEEDNEVIRRLAFNNAVWIGLFRDYWEWSGQSATYFRYWKREKPDNVGGNENCALSLLGEQGIWDDWPCAWQFPFFCHGPLKSKLSVVKTRILSTSDPNELGISDQLLQQLQVQLGNLKVSDYRLSWKVQQDGQIFQEEEDGGPEQKGGCEVEEG